jgi:hypothetical protein
MNVCEQMDSLYTCMCARAMLNVLHAVAREHCLACKNDDLSQRHHDCIMLSDSEKLKRYFVTLLEQIHDDEVSLQWSECVSTMDIPPDLLAQYQLKLHDAARGNISLRCAEWKQTLLDTVLQMITLRF